MARTSSATEPKGLEVTGKTSRSRVSYRLSEVACMSGIGLRTVQRRVAEGQLVAHRTGSIVVVFQEDLDEWLSGFERVKPAAADVETDSVSVSMEFDTPTRLDGAA
ncbi:DNA-binding protein [Mycobacteroides abscessus]|nr:DNA-binding protein [Mycobacteroides abscessus]PVA80623.1 DNA-binding protein [Mycobacteroides abscessus]RIR25270.1 DNA-binding protein [Mycobacteroides abscessus]RIT94996.1 DNA-binding protein [Mycobacteroides abscessus]SKY95823.1 DNA binding domain, excisionase family [Mycobacteroides abscessus subsp. abscessus]